MKSYSVYVESSVAELLFHLKAGERNRILRLLEKLRANPFVEGDYAESDDVGRLVQVLIIGSHAVCFWPDHALKEVKILDLRFAGN